MKVILVDAVDTLIIEGEGVLAEMQQLLDTFPNRKIILTNANDEQFITYGLDKDLPYEIFTLKHNPDKVDPVYFKKMLEHFNLGEDDVIYFEHNPDAVKSAESLGIKSYWYDADVKDLDALKQFLTDNM